jgi:hypothetical protein
MDASSQLGIKIIDGLKEAVGTAAWRALDPHARELVAEACAMAADLQIDALAYPASALADLASRKADVNAMLARVDVVLLPLPVFWRVLATIGHAAVEVGLNGI